MKYSIKSERMIVRKNKRPRTKKVRILVKTNKSIKKRLRNKYGGMPGDIDTIKEHLPIIKEQLTFMQNFFQQHGPQFNSLGFRLGRWLFGEPEEKLTLHDIVNLAKTNADVRPALCELIRSEVRIHETTLDTITRLTNGENKEELKQFLQDYFENGVLSDEELSILNDIIETHGDIGLKGIFQELGKFYKLTKQYL